jgi:peptidyl-tRNA hydrolase, PTH1 family
LGFYVADEIARYFNAAFSPGKGDYWQAKCSLKDTDVSLLKPTTYMNNSGIAVQDFQERNKVALENILIVCDDFQLPLGIIRLRQNGTDGGHNGLASIIYHLQSDQFSRLRCGISSEHMSNDRSQMRDFVLEKFDKSEVPEINQMVIRARDACIAFITDGVQSAMNQFNARPPEEEIN